MNTHDPMPCVPFARGRAYHAHPGIAHLIATVRSGELGPLRHICAWWGFEVPDAGHGGGAIGEMGGYPLSLAMLLAGAAAGGGFAEPESMRCTRREAESGADLSSHAQLRFSGGLCADLSCSLDTYWDMGVTLAFADGAVRVADPFLPTGHVMHFHTMSAVAPPRKHVVTAAGDCYAPERAVLLADPDRTLAVDRWLEKWRTQACDTAGPFGMPLVHP